MTGLKGLTAQDRADWEKKYAEQLKGRSEQEINNAYRHYKFKEKYGDREDYASLSKLSADEKEAYWNKQYDDSIASIKKDLSLERLDKDTIDTAIPSDASRVDIVDRQIKQQAEEDMPEFQLNSKAYNQALQKYTTDYDQWYKKAQNAEKDVKSLAEQVSPYYKRYKDTEYLPFSEQDWVNIAAEYNARKDTYGEENANFYLQKKIQDTASENQGIAEKWWNGFLNIGASASAMIIDATAGFAKGNYDYFFGDHKDIEGANAFTNYLDAIMDNNVTRYADKLIKTGTFFTDKQEEYEKSGISAIPVIQTYDQETGATDLMGMIFNENFLPTALGQYGFTLGSMIMGAAEAKLAQGVFKGIKGATLAANMQKTGQSAMQVRNALNWVQRAENAVNKYAIPGIVGTYEGLQEGLNTKMQFQEEGKRMVAQAQNDYVDAKFKELVDEKYQTMFDEAMSKQTFDLDVETGFAKGSLDPNQVSKDILNQLYQEAFDSYADKYQESLDQLEYDAALAGTNTFLINSVINGAINQTLKATLFNPSTTGAIRQTRLGKMVTPKGDFKVTGKGADIKVEAVLPWYKQAWNIIKEPLGEGIEEYSQDLADAAARGGARNNLETFINNKYNGDGSAVVGELWLSDLGGAWNSTTEAMLSKETWRDAISGVVSSVMGGPHIAHRTTAVDEKGNIIKDSKGRTKKTFFGRGLNAAGEVESNIERIARIMPWRSGAVQAINENKARKAELNSAAEQLTTWLRNPDNIAKYDGLTGTFNWAKQMQEAAEGNDEFGYRNSATGKAINDALMLSKLEGTEYYNAFMNQIVEAANLTSDSETAKQYIQTMRANVATKQAVEGLSDAEILQQIKDNANKMLDIQAKISESSKKLDKTFGNLDDDTKEALIFGELQIKDWQERQNKLQEEIKQINVQTSIAGTIINQQTKDFLAQYGSVKKAFADRDKLQNKLKELEENIRKTEERKAKLTDQQKAILAGQKATVKQTKQFLNKYKILEGLQEEDIVFNEQDILNMDPVSRAIILNPNNKSNYSLAQQAVIENLTQQLTAKDTELINKINDVARIQQATEKYLKDYQAVIANPETFNIYSKRAKAARQTENYKKRYQSISALQDYSEFSQAMDKLFIDGTTEERNTILRQFERDQQKADDFSTGTNYERYIQQRQKVAEILKNASRNPKMKDLSNDDIDMFVHATTYLTEKGIDMEDVNAVTNALTEQNSEGQNLFQNYVNAVNADADEATRTNFTSIGETLQTIKDIMSKYQNDVIETKANEAPIIVTPTTQESNTPKPSPTPDQRKPGIFGTAPTTLEESDKSLSKTQETEVVVQSPTPNGTTITVDGQTVSTPEMPIEKQPEVKEQPQPAQTEKSPLRQAYERNSNEEVARYAQSSYNLVSNSDKAKEVIERLSTNSFSIVEEFAEAINKEANILDTNNEDNESKKAAEALRNAYTKVITTYNNQKLQEARKKQLEESKQVENLQELARRSNRYAGALGINPALTDTQSHNVNTLDIQWLKNNFSTNPEDDNYSPLLAYLDRHKVEQFLASDQITRDTPVYFIYDPELSKEQQSVYSKGGHTFGQRNLSLIAVVESKNGTVQIGNKTYQPIGIMPATDARKISGSSRLNLVRDKININATTPELVTDNGKPIETILSDNVNALPIGQQSIGNNVTIQQAGFEGLSIQEQQELSQLPIAERRKHSAYKKLKNNFLQKVKVVEKKSRRNKSYKGLEYKIPTLKGGTTTVDVFVREVYQTKSANEDATIEELLRNNKTSVLNANSRIRGYFNKLNELLTSFSDSISFEEGIPTKGTIQAVTALLTDLPKKLDDYIRVRGYEYTLIPTQRRTSDGKAIMELSMTDGVNTILLGDIHSGNLTDSEKMTILKNLIMDSNNVRMQDSFHSVAKWNVFYPNFDTARLESTSENADKVRAAKADVSNIYDDDILDMAKPTLSYRVSTVSLEAPYTLEGERKVFPKPVNTDNAAQTTPLNDTPLAQNQVTATNNSTVDTDTGNTITGEDNIPKSEAEKIAKGIAETIQADATNFELSDDETYYIDKITGRKYARVTSMIAADEDGHSFSKFELPNGVHEGIIQGEHVLSYTGEYDRASDSQFTYFFKYKNGKLLSATIWTIDLENINEQIDTTMPFSAPTYEWKHPLEYKEVSDLNKWKEAKEILDYFEGKGKLNSWVTPSTNIGTGVDEFTRDFFADRFTYNTQSRTWEIDGKSLDQVYPNATAKAYSNFADQLNAFRNRLKADGITILPREVMAHGTLKATDSEGKVHSIDTAGTLDLLGYDKEGNWHIYDMKTIRNTNIDEHKKAKWARQLSVYKQFLENTYGIKVKDLSIIPIEVHYPDPRNIKYQVRNNKPEKYNGRADNQLIINKQQEFKGASPILLPTISIEERQLNIQYDKMSEADKQVEQEIKEQATQFVQDQTQAVNQDAQEAPTNASVQSIEVDNSNATGIIDPNTNIAGTSDDISNMFTSRKKGRKPSNRRGSRTYVPSSLAWGIFEGRGLNIEETIKNLESSGITEQKWEQMSNEEREHELDCKGIINT